MIVFNTSHWSNVGIAVIQLTQSSCKCNLSSSVELARFDLLVNHLCELDFQHDLIQRELRDQRPHLDSRLKCLILLGQLKYFG